MTAPIRPEHREAARTAIGFDRDYLPIDRGPRLVDRVAQLLADTEAAAVERVAAERALMDPREREPIMAAQVMEQAAEIARLTDRLDKAGEGWAACDDYATGIKSALAALSAEYAAAVRALAAVRAQACGIAKPCGHQFYCVCSADASERVLSTPRARAVLEQGETT